MWLVEGYHFFAIRQHAKYVPHRGVVVVVQHRMHLCIRPCLLLCIRGGLSTISDDFVLVINVVGNL